MLTQRIMKQKKKVKCHTFFLFHLCTIYLSSNFYPFQIRKSAKQELHPKCIGSSSHINGFVFALVIWNHCHH